MNAPDTHVLPAYGAGGVETFRALASEPRLAILALLAESPRNVAEIGASIGLAQPTVTKHVQILERAGLLTSEYLPGAQGMQKRCRLAHDRLLVSLEAPSAQAERVLEVSMPIGLYTTAHAQATCGLASPERIVGWLDDPQTFFVPERGSAEILWTADGFVEYVFPCGLPASREITRLEFMAELCSEAPHVARDWPSDITLWIDGTEVGTWTSPGDLGLNDAEGRRGRLNPDWWPEQMTQHGVLKIWSVDEGGSYVDGNPACAVAISDLRLRPGQPITVRLGIRPDAEHRGGFNLFGRGFGDYQQDLLLRLHYGDAPAFSERSSAERNAFERNSNSERRKSVETGPTVV